MTASSADDYFASRLRGLRQDKGITQFHLAEQMQSRGFRSFHQATIVKIEATSRKVSVGEAYELARIVGEDLATLLPVHVPADGDSDAEYEAFARLSDEERATLLDQQRLSVLLDEAQANLNRLRARADELPPSPDG